MMLPRSVHVVSVVALVAGSALGLALPARAAFPGRNGRIAIWYTDAPGGVVGPLRFGIALLRADLGATQRRADVMGCTVDGRRRGECPLDFFPTPWFSPDFPRSTPAFSPEGRLIAFDAGKRIAIVRADGRKLRLLPGTGRWAANPAWSPDGTKIIFDMARSNAAYAVRDLFVVAADGKRPAKLLVRDAANPSWSVGNLLAFERPSNARGGETQRIWVARAGGAGAHAVSSGVRGWKDYSRDPDFAPDGSRLVYVSLARNRLVTVGTNGRNSRALAATTANAYQPAFSPDGKRISWWSSAIYVAHSDGTSPRRIATDREGHGDPGDPGFMFTSVAPSWQPLAPFRTRPRS